MVVKRQQEYDQLISVTERVILGHQIVPRQTILSINLRLPDRLL